MQYRLQGENMKQQEIESPAARIPFRAGLSRFIDIDLCTFQLYAPPVPRFVEQEIEHLYENVYCTLSRMNIYGFDDNAHTFISKYDGKITDIFIFRISGATALVLNQQITIPECRIRYFVDTILSLFSRIKVVRFFAIDVEISDSWRLFHKWEAVRENIIVLPESRSDFDQKLSASFRYSLRSCYRKLLADFPSFNIQFYSGKEISDKDAQAVIELTHQRMAIKGNSSYLKERDTARIMQVLKNYGLLCVATIDDKVCGGSLWYAVGRRHMMHIISHDPRYDRYALGNCLNYQVFLYCIEQLGKECWMMGGNEAHKARFGAIPFKLYSYRFYRSHRNILRYFFDSALFMTVSLYNKLIPKVTGRIRGWRRK